MSAQWYGTWTAEAEERLVSVWSGAPVELPEVCSMLAEVASIQVWKFAPESFDSTSTTGEPLPMPEVVPARLVYAQLQQMQNLWNAGRAQQDGGIGGEGYSFIPRPLDKNIQEIIRPRGGVPRVF